MNLSLKISKYIDQIKSDMMYIEYRFLFFKFVIDKNNGNIKKLKHK